MTTMVAPDPDRSAVLRRSVSEEVRSLMGRWNMPRVKLAELMGQSRAYVGRRLSGETAFDLDDLQMLSDIFGVPVHTLICGAGEHGPHAPNGAGSSAVTAPTSSATSARNRAVSRWFDQVTGHVAERHADLLPTG